MAVTSLHLPEGSDRKMADRAEVSCCALEVPGCRLRDSSGRKTTMRAPGVARVLSGASSLPASSRRSRRSSLALRESSFLARGARTTTKGARAPRRRRSRMLFRLTRGSPAARCLHSCRVAFRSQPTPASHGGDARALWRAAFPKGSGDEARRSVSATTSLRRNKRIDIPSPVDSLAVADQSRIRPLFAS